MNGEKILIDTSVWISYLRDKATAFSKQVDDILSKNEIYVPKIVMAELIQGSKSDREIAVVKDFADAFHIIDQKEDTWLKAGRLSFSMKRKGITVHIIDCYIAVIASENGCGIFSLDEHFKNIKKFLHIDLLA